MYPEHIDWNHVSANPSAISLLEANPEKINWRELSRNPEAIHLLEKNLDKIDWDYLSFNTNAVPLLHHHQDKINWNHFCVNPSMFQVDLPCWEMIQHTWFKLVYSTTTHTIDDNEP